MPTLVIMRGISGSGKSTYISKNFPGATICSADLYFFDQMGKYHFDPRKLGKAHEFSQMNCKVAMDRGDQLVVVDNTNTQLWEMQPYIEMAQARGYTVVVFRLVCNPQTAAARNLHGVPLTSVQKMTDRFEDFKGELLVDSEH